MNEGFQMAVDTGAFEALANTVKGYGQELSSLATKYLNDIKSMRDSGAWVSSASEQYVNKCSEFKGRVDQLNNKIEGLSSTMTASAQAIAEAEAANVAKASSLL